MRMKILFLIHGELVDRSGVGKHFQENQTGCTCCFPLVFQAPHYHNSFKSNSEKESISWHHSEPKSTSVIHWFAIKEELYPPLFLSNCSLTSIANEGSLELLALKPILVHRANCLFSSNFWRMVMRTSQKESFNHWKKTAKMFLSMKLTKETV